MKDKVKVMFEDIQMPKDCEEKILRAAATPKRRKRPILRPLLATAAMLVLVFTLSPTVRAAVGELAERFRISGTGLSVSWGVDPDGTPVKSMTVDENALNFAELREGRLYFTGNGQNMDITDLVAEDSPFVYTYEEQGFTICLAVGFAGNIENFGIHEIILDADGHRHAGTGQNDRDPKTGKPYPWLDIVMEELNLSLPISDE